MEYMVGVDIGGTFTDCVVVDEDGNFIIGKALSTPHDFSEGVFNAVADAARSLGLNSDEDIIRSTRIFFHATTVGENTAFTRSGARTGLIATRGFEDTVLMMRGKTTDGLTEAEAAHLSAITKPDPFVPRPLIEGVNERVDFLGNVLVRLDRGEAKQAIQKLRDKGVESVAVSLLWSVTNGEHEKLLADLLQEEHPDVFISLSSDTAPLVGEYERTITTVLNAYIGPKMSAYLHNFHRGLKSRGLPGDPLVMQAYGGVLDVEAARKNAVGTIESGPAAGVVGSHFLGELVGEQNILATDMGGTTFKVGVVREGVIEREYSPVFQRYRLLSPKIWVESIGTGGGSIAWIDPETNTLKVGPQGAGASPGPVCYGFGGTEPTVSDADLVLGYLDDEYFLGGRMTVDKAAAWQAIEEKIARPLGMSVIEAASGIYRITNAHMSDLIRKATVERGHDPREFTLFAFGGAAAVHASRYAADLDIERVLVPITASVHGATGLVASDVMHQYGKSDHVVVPVDLAHVNANFSALVEQALADLKTSGFRPDQMQVIRSVDMRYRHQVHEVNVALPEGSAELTEQDMEELYDEFDRLYEQLYGPGSAYRAAGKEILAFRVRAIGLLPKPKVKRAATVNSTGDDCLKGQRQVFFEERGDFVPTNIYDFDSMQPGTRIKGPAIIETPVTTIVVNPKDHAEMDELRNVSISVGL